MRKVTLCAAITVIMFSSGASYAEQAKYSIRFAKEISEQHKSDIKAWAPNVEKFGAYAISTAKARKDANGNFIPQSGVAGLSTGAKHERAARTAALKACNGALKKGMGRCVVIGTRIPK